MSSFVVKDKTINRIVGYFKMGRNQEWAQRMILKETGLDITKTGDDETFGKLLLMLNIQAVNDRYAETEDGTAELLTYRFESKSYLDGGMVAAFKSFQCFMYQCSEGAVIDTDLYKLMKELKGNMAERVIETMLDKQYDKAEWA